VTDGGGISGAVGGVTVVVVEVATVDVDELPFATFVSLSTAIDAIMSPLPVDATMLTFG